MTVLFLVWAAELDQYVFQDSQLDGLGEDIFSKLGGLLAQPAFPSLFLGEQPDDLPSKDGQILPQHTDNEGSFGASTDCVLQSLSFFFPPKVEHIGLDEIISENVEVLEEAGQKSQKRRE